MKLTINTADYFGILLGSVHNIGAGGVLNNGAINKDGIKPKRYAQWLNRTNKSTGLVGIVWTVNSNGEVIPC